MDLSSGTPWETVTLTALSRDRELFAKLLEEAKNLAMERQVGKTVIYTSYGPEWRIFGQPRRRRPIDSVVLAKGVAERLLTDVKEFLDHGKWYTERGIPYRRGYLLYGPPGTGKSSFIQALAGELEYDICILNLGERGLTDDRLNHLLSHLPARSILLLEDVDAAFVQRVHAKEGFHSMVTFSGLLNALDGVAASEERLIFMTTNHVDRLDAALTRPGRVDVTQLINLATEEQIQRMFLRFYGEEGRPHVERFVKALNKRPISSAALQGLFIAWKREPKEAILHIESLFPSSAAAVLNSGEEAKSK